MVLLVKRDTTITIFYCLLVSEFAADRELFEQLLVEAILLNLKTTCVLRHGNCRTGAELNCGAAPWVCSMTSCVVKLHCPRGRNCLSR